MSDPDMSDSTPPSHPGPPPEPGPAPTAGPAPGGVRYADLGKRFLARLIDALLVGVPLTIVLWLLPGISVGGLIANVLSAVVGLGYFVVLETSQGATFGKQWLGLQVTDEAGTSPITTDASLRRNWWLLLGVLGSIPVIGFLAGLASLAVVIVIVTTISSDARGQGWHDKLAGTLVIERATS